MHAALHHKESCMGRASMGMIEATIISIEQQLIVSMQSYHVEAIYHSIVELHVSIYSGHPRD